jgi:hypothetical protein
MEKNMCGPFSLWPVSYAPTPAHLCVLAGLPAHYQATVADKRGPPVRAVFPQILPGRALVGIAAVILTAAPSTRHHPFVVTIPACARTTLSHRVGCGGPWHPITVARLRLPSSTLRQLDSRADRSVMKSSSRPLRWPSFRCQMRAVEVIV